MLKKTDIKEISKTLEINNCSIQNMVGAYVDQDKNIVCNIDQRFLTMPEELLFKYLALAKKLYNKNIGDNVLSAPFGAVWNNDETKRLLNRLLESRLKDEVLLDELYERIIDEYDCVGNYLILLWYDVYDIPGRGTDGEEQDESETVYPHIMCAICKVNLTAAGLSYDPKQNEFAVRERDWVVEYPSCGFVYPSFEERTPEYENILFYTREPKTPPHDFMERGLGMEKVRTITEIRNAFVLVLKKALGSTTDADYWLPHIGKQLFLNYEDNEEAVLLPEELEDFCGRTGMGEVQAQDIRNEYVKEFGSEYPKTAYFLNRSMVKKVQELIKKQEIQNTFREAAVQLNTLQGPKDLVERLHTLADGK